MKKTFLFLAILLFVNFSRFDVLAQNLTDKNLILYYPFDGDAKDQKGNGKTFKIDDTPQKQLFRWVEGKDGKPNSALQFLGNCLGLKPGINISPNRYPEFTFTAWVYGRPYGYLFGTSLPSDEYTKIISRCLLFNNDRVEAGYMMYSDYSKVDQASYLSSSDLPEDEWNFIALTANAKDSTMTLYAGGEYYQVWGGGMLKKIIHTKKGGDLIFGNSTSGSSMTQFRGKVDEIKVFDKALTKEELTQLSGINFNDARIRIERENLIKQILTILLLLFFVFMIVYSAVVIFKEKKYKKVSDAELEQFIAESKSSPDISATNDLAYKYIEDSFNAWPEMQRQEDEIYRAPRKRKHIVATYQALEKARSLKPSEKYITDRMNELGEICNNLSKRRFYGNKLLPAAGMLFPILFFVLYAAGGITTSAIMTLVVMLLPVIAYILTSFAPTYLVANRKHGSGGIFGAVIGAIIGAGAVEMATEYYTETTWSDGHKTVEYDAGSGLASLIIGFIVIVIALILALVLTGIAAIISFFRNFVFYI